MFFEGGSMVQSVEVLIILRFLQGALAGTIVAAQTMVAAYTPENRSGAALGALSAAVYSESMVGTFLGGIFAEYFGYRYSFFASGMLLAVAGLLVFFGAFLFVGLVPLISWVAKKLAADHIDTDGFNKMD